MAGWLMVSDTLACSSGIPSNSSPMSAAVSISHAEAPHLALGQFVVRVVPGQRGMVKIRAQPGLPMGQQKPIPLVGSPRRPKPGNLPARPQPAAVHRGVGAPGKGELAGVAQVGVRVKPAVGQLLRGVERGDGDAGEGARGCHYCWSWPSSVEKFASIVTVARRLWQG